MKTLLLDGGDYPMGVLRAGIEARVNCQLYPLLLGLAASAVGTGLQVAGSEESRAAMESTRANFLAQQEKLQKQASQVFQNSAKQASADAAKATLDKGADQRSQLVQALKQASATDAGLPQDTVTSYEVTDDPTRRAANVAQTAGAASRTAQSTAAAKLGAYDDFTAQQQLDNAEASRQLAPIASKSQGNARILPGQMEAASHAGDSLSQWGQIVGALGSVASLGAASGFGAASTGATAAQTAATTGGWSGNLFTSLAGGMTPSVTTAAPAAGSWANAVSGLVSPALSQLGSRKKQTYI